MNKQKNNPRQNIVLIGMMGVGKTAVGRMLARELNYDFVDTDNELENVTGLKVLEIYRKYGQIRFQSEEALLVKKLLPARQTVVSTGGTMALSEANAQALAQLGFVVWLKATPQTIFNRTCRKGKKSLLPKGATLETVEDLVETRQGVFSQIADFEVWVDQHNLEEVVALIQAKYLENCQKVLQKIK